MLEVMVIEVCVEHKEKRHVVWTLAGVRGCHYEYGVLEFLRFIQMLIDKYEID